jgi:hypothetical protein
MSGHVYRVSMENTRKRKIKTFGETLSPQIEIQQKGNTNLFVI